MDNEVFHCEDGELSVYCNVCDKLCIEGFCKNHLKSRTHNKNNRKKVLIKINMIYHCHLCDKNN